MKTDNMLLLGGAAVLAYLFFSKKKEESPAQGGVTSDVLDSLKNVVSQPTTTGASVLGGTVGTVLSDAIQNNPLSNAWDTITGNQFAAQAKSTQSAVNAANVYLSSKGYPSNLITSVPLQGGSTLYYSPAGVNYQTQALIESTMKAGGSQYGFTPPSGGAVVYSGSSSWSPAGTATASSPTVGSIMTGTAASYPSIVTTPSGTALNTAGTISSAVSSSIASRLATGRM